MRTLFPFDDREASERATASETIGHRPSRLHTRSLPVALWMISGLAGIAVIGFLDLSLSPRLDLECFYLIATAALAWKVGLAGAVAGAILSGIFICCGELWAGAETTSWLSISNVAIRLGGLAAAGWLASIASGMAGQLDSMVGRRTARLQEEVERHKETAMRWHEMAQLFRQLTENITEVFWVSDPRRKSFSYLSPGYEKIWHRPCREAYQDPDTVLHAVHKDDRDRVARAIEAAPTHGGFDEEYRVVWPDGTIRWVHDRAFPVRDERKQVYRLAGIAEDITERRRQAELRNRLEGQILEISDREQARIGQDIHDGLCQQLVGAAFAVNALKQSLATQGNAGLTEASFIARLLDEAMTEARRVARGLYPVRLSTKGLVSALQELATGIATRFKMRCNFEADGEEIDCGTTVATHLYRIAQEALNNAAKHSGGSEITVRLTTAGEAIALEVNDNGHGTVRKDGGDAGMGLHIMHYRANSIGANLKISGGAGGTRVFCHVPLDPATTRQFELNSGKEDLTSQTRAS